MDKHQYIVKTFGMHRTNEVVKIIKKLVSENDLKVTKKWSEWKKDNYYILNVHVTKDEERAIRTAIENLDRPFVLQKM